MLIMNAMQKRFFDTFGFLVLRNFLSKSEISCISHCLNAALPVGKKRKRNVRDGYASVLLMGETASPINQFAYDPRFSRSANELLRRKTICVQVAGHCRTGDTWWHSDNYTGNYTGIKFLCYLEALDANSGALRVMPGSHKDPLWRKSNLSFDTETTFGVAPERMPASVLPTRPGDVIAFHHRLWHASFGGNQRRFIEFNYYTDPSTLSERRAFITQMRRNHTPSAAIGQQMYPADWRNLDNPQVKSWVCRLRALKVLDTMPT